MSGLIGDIGERVQQSGGDLRTGDKFFGGSPSGQNSGASYLAQKDMQKTVILVAGIVSLALIAITSIKQRGKR